MTERFKDPVLKWTTDTLKTLPGALLYFYENGTTTPKAIYADPFKDDVLANPVEADSAGVFVPIFLDGTYRVELKNALRVTQTGWPVDNVGGEETGGSFDDYSPLTSYSEGELVTGSNGLRYESQQNANLNHDPTIAANVPTWWLEVRLSNSYNAISTYSLYDRVQYTDGYEYISLQNSNTGNNPSSATGFWKRVKDFYVWDAGTTYLLDQVTYVGDVKYISTANGNINHNPTVASSFWKEEKYHYVWNSGASYSLGEASYVGEFRYISKQNANVNHNPSTDTAQTFWKPDWQLWDELTLVNTISGGGTLSAYRDNKITDGNAGYLLPLASTVPNKGWIIVSKSDIARTLYPIITRSGSDTIAYLGGTDTSFQIDTQFADSMILFSNGVSQWSF